MFGSFPDVKQYISKEAVEIIDLKYTDFNGQLRHLTIPPARFDEKLLQEGMGFDGSSVGYKKTHAGDMALIPDLSTGLVDPFWSRRTLSFLCDIVEAESKEASFLDPRNIAKCAENYLSRMDWVDESSWGPELEFYVFDKVSYDIGTNHSRYQIVSGESSFDSEDLNDGYHSLPMDGYHAAPPRDADYEVRSEIVSNLTLMGIDTKYNHHEVGAAGEMEIEIPMGSLLQTADRVVLIKYVAKMTGRKWGKSVTFMPKPNRADGGNAMHVHQTLWKAKRNLFYDEKGYSGLSEIALFYIAGLLKHGPALLALTNPSTNSYRRLVPGFEAPTNLFFSAGNRTAAIRIPKYARSEESKRIEFRPADATSNIYFSLTSQLLAGLDGIEEKIDPTDYGPIDEDIQTWQEDESRNIRQLPVSLDAALEELKQDHEFLLKGGIFSEDFVSFWIEHKIKRELHPIRGIPHPYEFALYYDV